MLAQMGEHQLTIRDHPAAQSSECHQPISASRLEHQASGAGQTVTCDPASWMVIEKQVLSDPVVLPGIAFSPARSRLWLSRCVELECVRSLLDLNGPKFFRLGFV